MTQISEAVSFDMSRDHAIRENMMPNGEKFAIYRVANTSLYQVAHAGSGKPTATEELDGMFTSPARAQEAIEKYLTGVWERVKKQPNPNVPVSTAELNKRADRESHLKG